MTIPTVINSVNNPFTGIFGNGQIVTFLNSGTFTVPSGVASVRVRVWGAGGFSGGGGGGFTMRTITGLTPGTPIAVTVGAGSTSAAAFGGTSSFGSFCSATGGGSGSTSPVSQGGVGTGGDINTTGGAGPNGNGGVAGMWGNGGAGGSSSLSGVSGNSGGGGSSSSGNSGGNGIYGIGGSWISTTSYVNSTTGFISGSIDFIGTGGGGANTVPGINGGGGGNSSNGGFPGGGSGVGAGGRGLVIVEY
jgi:hypothetical protein